MTIDVNTHAIRSFRLSLAAAAVQPRLACKQLRREHHMVDGHRAGSSPR